MNTNHNNYPDPYKRFLDTQNKLNELNKKISKYRFRILVNMDDEKGYQAYVNSLHKDIRDEMASLEFNKAKEIARQNIENLKELSIHLSCMKTLLGSIYGNYKPL